MPWNCHSGTWFGQSPVLVDILVLQRVFHRKIPFLKFFIKKELFWFPFLGQAWWALDFPFIKRYSKAKLQKKPHLRAKTWQSHARPAKSSDIFRFRS